MEQAVSRRKKVKISIAPTYDDSRAKIALWNDPLGWISWVACNTWNGPFYIQWDVLVHLNFV